MKLVRSGDASIGSDLKTLIYAQSGAGKTHWASRAPMPLFLLFEPQGKVTISAVRDDASIIELSTWEEFKAVFDIIKLGSIVTTDNGQSAMAADFGKVKCVWQTLVIDSITHLQQAMITSMLKLSTAKRLDLATDRSITQSQWGKLLDVMSVTMDQVRALPCNVVAIALADEKYDELKRRRVIPDLQGQARRKIPQFFNAVGYATVDVDGNRVIVWESDARFCVKPAPGWPRITSADVTLGSLSLHSIGTSAMHEETDTVDGVMAAFDKYHKEDEE